MAQNTYTYTTVVQNAKAVFDQIIIHCMNKERQTVSNTRHTPRVLTEY